MYNMMTSSNVFPVTGPLWGEFTGHRWTPLHSQRPVTRSFDVFFDLHLNKIYMLVIWDVIAVIMMSQSYLLKQ